MNQEPPRSWAQRHPVFYVLVGAPALIAAIALIQARGLEVVVFFGVFGAVLGLGGLGLSGVRQKVQQRRHRSEYEAEEQALEEGR